VLNHEYRSLTGRDDMQLTAVVFHVVYHSNARGGWAVRLVCLVYRAAARLHCRLFHVEGYRLYRLPSSATAKTPAFGCHNSQASSDTVWVVKSQGGVIRWGKCVFAGGFQLVAQPILTEGHSNSPGMVIDDI
jgi:hypothetical protein